MVTTGCARCVTTGSLAKRCAEESKKTYVSPFDLALIHVALGEKDKAFALLGKALAEHSTFLVYSKWEPRLDPLRSDPRFQALLKRINFPNSPEAKR